MLCARENIAISIAASCFVSHRQYPYLFFVFTMTLGFNVQVFKLVCNMACSACILRFEKDIRMCDSHIRENNNYMTVHYKSTD